MKKLNNFIVAVKDTKTIPGKIRPGKILGSYREVEFARRAFSSLVRQAGFEGSAWRVGIFENAKLIS